MNVMRGPLQVRLGILTAISCKHTEVTAFILNKKES